MTDEDLHEWIIHLIETNMDEENRKRALEWLGIRVVAFDAMKQSGLIADDDLVALGLKAKGEVTSMADKDDPLKVQDTQ